MLVSHLPSASRATLRVRMMREVRILLAFLKLPLSNTYLERKFKEQKDLYSINLLNLIIDTTVHLLYNFHKKPILETRDFHSLLLHIKDKLHPWNLLKKIQTRGKTQK